MMPNHAHLKILEHAWSYLRLIDKLYLTGLTQPVKNALHWGPVVLFLLREGLHEM